MKIRIALNTDFVARKIRGVAYGILLLLTFFVPQFAKTQDQLNAAKSAQAALKTGIELEQNQVKVSLGNSQDAYSTIMSKSDVKPVAEQTNRQQEQGEPPTWHAPDIVASSAIPKALSAISTSEREIVRFSESPVAIEVTQPVAPAMTQSALITALTPAVLSPTLTPIQEVVGFSEPPVAIEVKQPAAPTSKMEIVRFSESPVEAKEFNQQTAFDATQTLQIASLPPAFLPAQSISEPGQRFTGEFITVDAVNVPLIDFFRAMAEIGDINILLDPAITGNITALKVVKMPWDQLFDIVMLNYGLDRQIIEGTIRVARKSTLQQEAAQEEALKKASMMAGDLDTRVKRLNYAKASEMKALLADQKTARGTVVVDDRSNSLIVTDLPDSLKNMWDLLALLDVSEPQVEIETRIVSATRNFARDIGVQFGFVQGNSQRVTVGGSNAAYLQPGPASRPMGETSSSDSPGVSAGLSDTGGNLNVNLPARSAFGGVGIAVGNILDTFLLDAAITAGESKGTAKLISQPKVVVQNNSPAVINNGVRFPVTVNQDNTITVQFFDAALNLTATPQITYDGNIMLELKVSNNTADWGNQSVIGTPSIRTSETSTRIMISDGGTTVIAGILVEDDSNTEDRIPGLASLPLIGNLFRRTGATRDTQDILFIVTPRILK